MFEKYLRFQNFAPNFFKEPLSQKMFTNSKKLHAFHKMCVNLKNLMNLKFSSQISKNVCRFSKKCSPVQKKCSLVSENAQNL